MSWPALEMQLYGGSRLASVKNVVNFTTSARKYGEIVLFQFSRKKVMSSSFENEDGRISTCRRVMSPVL